MPAGRYAAPKNYRTITCATIVMLLITDVAAAQSRIRELFEGWFGDDEQPTSESASALEAGNCPETVSFFYQVEKWPESCGTGRPPDYSGRPAPALAHYEGVWDIRFVSDEEQVHAVGLLAKGLDIVGFRSEDVDWSFKGVWTAPIDADEMPYLNQMKGTVESITADSLVIDVGSYRSRLRRSGNSLIGTFEHPDSTGITVWKKREPPKISSITFSSSIDDVVKPFEEAGRMEMSHPVTCGYGNMRGNCPNVTVTINGWSVVGPHEIWIDPVEHMELIKSHFLFRNDSNSADHPGAMTWEIAGRGSVKSIQLHFALRDGINPGPKVLWFDGQPIPFDVVIHGYPEERTPEALPELISLEVQSVNGHRRTSVNAEDVFVVEAQFEDEHPDPWVSVQIDGASQEVDDEQVHATNVTLWRTEDASVFQSRRLQIVSEEGS